MLYKDHQTSAHSHPFDQHLCEIIHLFSDQSEDNILKCNYKRPNLHNNFYFHIAVFFVCQQMQNLFPIPVKKIAAV